VATFENDYGVDETLNINIDLEMLAAALAKHPTFVKAMAEHVRTAQTKQVRRMGNLYGQTAQKPKPAPATKRRLR
jgi:uncharacterized protein (DUF305 family)